jgi:hypothetical protein
MLTYAYNANGALVKLILEATKLPSSTHLASLD